MKTYAQLPTDSTAPSVELFDGDVHLGSANVTGNTWSLTLSNPLPLGPHTLTARAHGKTSAPRTFTVVEQDSGFNLSRPTVKEASTIEGDKQRLNYYDVNGDIHVQVQDEELKPGDTVKLYWFGRSITLGSAIRTVRNPQEILSFTILRYEVVDVIGTNASIYYTVKRPPSDEIHSSKVLSLIVDGQAYNIQAPTLDKSHEKLTVVRQPQFNAETTVEVRCIGGDDDSDVWESRYLTFGNNMELVFTIDATWRAKYKTKGVKFCASIRVTPNGNPPYLISQLLRVSPL